MNESNQDMPVETRDPSPAIELNPGQRYETSKGTEYIIDYIARESGNIEDLFVVYKEVDSPRQNWLKKTTDIKTVDDFDEGSPLTHEQMSEIMRDNESETISINQKYQHFKTKDFYLIKAIARNPAKPTEKFIIYEGQYNSPEFGNHPIWVREYSDFTGMKEFDDGRESVKRFALIN